MYKLANCIRLGLLVGALLGIAIETVIALQGSNATAFQLLLRSAYGIAHAAVLT